MWPSNSGTAFTIARLFTTRRTRSRLPSAPRSDASTASPVTRALAYASSALILLVPTFPRV